MSAFTLEKPRPLGTRKRGFGSTDFNGKTLRPTFFLNFQYENRAKDWPQGFLIK
jgi:hypothetical protein